MPAAFITMISESLRQLVEDVRDRDQQRDRRDHQNEQRYDQAGDADEDQDGLALAGHDVDVAQRLRDPDHGGQADQHDQERTQGGAENISADRPHPQHRPLIRQQPDPACGFPTGRASASSLKLNPRQIYLDRLTKWPGKGKAVEHAQQNVNVARLPRPAKGRPTDTGIPPKLLGFSMCLWGRHGKSAESLSPGFAESLRARHMGVPWTARVLATQKDFNR